MSKLSATLSKKAPIPGLEYSSQQFSCGMELELSGEQTQDSIRQNIRRMYALLHAAIDEEIREAAANPPAFVNSLQSASPRHAGGNRSGNWHGGSRGGGRPTRWTGQSGGSRYGGGQAPGHATQAQVKAVFAIAKGNGMERQDIVELLEERFGVSRPEELSVKDASKLIDTEQLHLYAIAARKTGLLEQVGLPLVLRVDSVLKTKVSEVIPLTITPDAASERRVIAKARQIWKSMSAGVCFPSSSWRCADCGYRKQCGQWPDIAGT